MCDRFAAEGFVALAPDLYHGETTTEPDEAGKLMMALNIDQAAKDMGGAVDYLLAHDAVTLDALGVIGFCMGGGLALVLAAQRPDAIGACVPFYGLIPWADARARLVASSTPRCRATSPRTTGSSRPSKAASSRTQLRATGKDVELDRPPGRRPRLLQRHPPEVHDAETVGRGAGPDASPFLRDRHQLSDDRAVGRPTVTLVERYLELGLRLGRHLDGLVDAYYGPAELRGARRGRADPRPARWSTTPTR